MLKEGLRLHMCRGLCAALGFCTIQLLACIDFLQLFRFCFLVKGSQYFYNYGSECIRHMFLWSRCSFIQQFASVCMYVCAGGWWGLLFLVDPMYLLAKSESPAK